MVHRQEVVCPHLLDRGLPIVRLELEAQLSLILPLEDLEPRHKVVL